MSEALATARAAFTRRDWAIARQKFDEARAHEALDADDWYALAEAAWWLGDIDESLAAFESAHWRYVQAGSATRAVRAAMFLGLHTMERGDDTVGSAWLKRAHRLLRDEPEGPEHGYPLYLDIFSALGEGDFEGGARLARRMQELGRRFDEPDLVGVGVLGEGRALIKQGHIADGMALLDDAMLTALSDRLHPVWTGAIYCHLMDVCHELVDIRRASEWTQATARWCEQLPPAVVYRGICRVHRAQVLQVQGAWTQAEHEARQAGAELNAVHVGTVAEAYYEVGEIRRLCGDFSAAEDSFQRARELGRDPQPGQALLRGAQGHVRTAYTSLATALAERSADRLGRVRLLAAFVDTAIAAGEIEDARAASDELATTASDIATPGLQALARRARGAVTLAEGAPREALAALRDACQRWHALDAPYEAARTRLLIAQACRALADEDAAARELEAAQASFEQLGAVPDARRAHQLRGETTRPDGLTPREVEVLRVVATGKRNRDVAADLYLSEKTVARHLANIYTKLGLSSRAAATAYAFEHGLVDPPSG